MGNEARGSRWIVGFGAGAGAARATGDVLCGAGPRCGCRRCGNTRRGRSVTRLADGDLALTMLELEKIEFRLLKQSEDFEHVVFGQFHLDRSPAAAW